ncbi:hypothetical protein ACFPFP_40875 [Bradyrhizobium sp. GCM10023182]|uniref:Class I SAM-dependent methyltransferase n=1 Tax=Bradyrhizobium zhengyangense TaxID=2911009 RepID=A0ABS9M1S6_9BRAD|nr:hypothetical protein [Bradyrhizobium zhengyangense]MCG2673217.1 hypothetical protein [Bradyrhizobium zhengyangense]
MAIGEKLFRRIYGEAARIGRKGSFREREQFGLISRPNYLYGMLRAADCARYFGKTRVTAVEFGVASGAGLLNMVELASLIHAETGIEFRIVGFDTGKGLPQIQGYKDHPEIWNPGDFAMEQREQLLGKLGDRAEIIWGDIGDTVGPFTQSIDATAPLGFVSIDVDIYSATKSALKCLTGPTESYVPALSMYFDDINFFFANEWAGELAAIAEFNAENALRKIGQDRSLPGHRPIKAESWYSAMYVCHFLDHPARQTTATRPRLSISAHAEFMKSRFLF